MTNKENHTEQRRRVRSRSRKFFYRKLPFWLMVGLLALSVIVAIFIFKKKEDDSNEMTKENTSVNDENIHGSVDSKNENDIEQTYTYDDFKGTYALFNEEPYESGASLRYIFEEDYYQVHDFWEYGLEVDILNKSIEGNVLTIEYNVEDYEYYGFDEKHIKEEFELRENGNSKSLHSLTSGETLHSISKNDLENYYDQLEIDYARIIMSVLGGQIPLDGWAISSPVTINISHSSANEPLGGWGDAPSYPKDVTHLTSNLLDDLSYLSDAIYNSTITYYAHGDGNINLYYLNQEGAERVGQEKIEDLGTIYVNPSEPYFVADFIGRVNFIYE